MKNKWGRIVSKRKHNLGKKNKAFAKAGYVTKKGKFGSFKKSKQTKKKSRGKKK